MSTETFNRGDIVRWRAFIDDVDYYYGLVLDCEDFSAYGHLDYPYFSYDELTGVDYNTFMTRKITLFSFYDQKVVVVHQSEADVPVFPELVHVFEDTEIEKI
ncbi:MAG: hypothetical protein KAR20_04665 [Candidatus Heimdallarchaeota archaeon]|nr:hypothetical protein [Candidatus Heimdallarchaeota archaeon]